MVAATAPGTLSEQQRERLDRLDERYPGTHFQVVMYWPLSCALVIEWWDGAGEGDFTLAPNGRLVPIHGELPPSAEPMSGARRPGTC